MEYDVQRDSYHTAAPLALTLTASRNSANRICHNPGVQRCSGYVVCIKKEVIGGWRGAGGAKIHCIHVEVVYTNWQNYFEIRSIRGVSEFQGGGWHIANVHTSLFRRVQDIPATGGWCVLVCSHVCFITVGTCTSDHGSEHLNEGAKVISLIWSCVIYLNYHGQQGASFSSR